MILRKVLRNQMQKASTRLMTLLVRAAASVGVTCFSSPVCKKLHFLLRSKLHQTDVHASKTAPKDDWELQVWRREPSELEALLSSSFK